MKSSIVLGSFAVLALSLAPSAPAQEATTPTDHDNRVLSPERELAGTELVLVFAMFRHGDRTPDLDEITLYPHQERHSGMFFPYGMKALTNAGKARSYRIGQYLRRRYDGFVSRLYLPHELALRCTDFDRTKMSALAAMAGLYPPERLQRWNPALAWQPVPYDVHPAETCDMLYWYNCPAYLKTRNNIYELNEMAARIKNYGDLFEKLTNYTGKEIRTPEDVFYLDNLFQTEQNVNITIPKWAEEVIPKIKEMTKLEFEAQFYNDRLMTLAFGVMLREILDTADRAVRGVNSLPKLHLYSAHENNLAAMMAATRTFYPHQPDYGATFALELRRFSATGKYAFAAIYTPTAGGTAKILPVAGCGGGVLCDHETFVNLTSNIAITVKEFQHLCYA